MPLMCPLLVEIIPDFGGFLGLLCQNFVSEVVDIHWMHPIRDGGLQMISKLLVYALERVHDLLGHLEDPPPAQVALIPQVVQVAGQAGDRALLGFVLHLRGEKVGKMCTKSMITVLKTQFNLLSRNNDINIPKLTNKSPMKRSRTYRRIDELQWSQHEDARVGISLVDRVQHVDGVRSL